MRRRIANQHNHGGSMPKTYVHTELGGPETQQFLDLPVPVPAEGQILIKVRAAGVNPADWKRRSNYSGTATPLTAPQPMGIEAAGVVEAVGPGVEAFAVGEEVFGSVVGAGAWGEYTLLDAAIAAHKPAGVSFADAATLPVAAATAYDGIRQLDLGPGETLLITGAGGGVGIAAAQLAIAEGVKVIGTASESKKGLISSIGAVHVAYGPGVVERVREVAPDGIHGIYDTVGGDALRDLKDLAPEGSKVITAADGVAAAELGGSRVERARNGAVLEAVAALTDSGALKPFVTATFPLDQTGEALALVESGHATGKVVIEVL
jgi:NADPH:quinone reductase-like Zn-dependent oxidoreductase